MTIRERVSPDRVTPNWVAADPAVREAAGAASSPRTVHRVVVVGAGIAGLQTALALRRIDQRCDVVLVAKEALTESNTRYAQGGIAAVVPDPPTGAGPDPLLRDSVEDHISDTLAAGAGLADPQAVDVLCRGAAAGIDALRAAGVVFDQGADGAPSLARGREAAHSAARILHLGGDATGAGLVARLVTAVRCDPGISVLEHATVTRIVTGIVTGIVRGIVTGSTARRPRAVGIEVLHDRAARVIAADAVVLATGGAGQLFEHTTNPAIATGDGVALAWRAGAAVADLEFFQFHPTSLDAPGNPLISEAVRGEGAGLVDGDGYRFMTDYHPDGDLAPRDVVSRSIARHASLRGEVRVYLDATALGADFLSRRFPFLTALTARHGYDWGSAVVPIVPAAHYWMGGVRTDTEGRTSVAGLYAVGEVARTGVHGANRLASNSLLEGVVFGERCAAAVLAGVPRLPVFDAEPLDPGAEIPGVQSFSREDLQALMADHAGVVRSGSGLGIARKQLASYRPDGDAGKANLLLCARLLVHAAEERRESRGAHYRSDYPDHNPRQRFSRTYVRASEGEIR